MEPELGTILGVWAHPDDETYLSAGVMAAAGREGRRVVCVTATRGEAGSQDEQRWPASDIARIREAELDEALTILGVREHHWLDYRDGTCESVPHEEGVAKVATILEAVAPDTVLTFGPDGQTGHHDHIAVSRWTTAAFERAAKPGARLCYATVTPDWAQSFVDTLNQHNVFEPGTPEVTPVEELSINFSVTGDLLEAKVRALRAQISQTEGLIAALGEEFLRSGISEETFRRAR
ncbi:MAG: PIG-L deacetylase family protein [Actinomycetota bacterium]